MLLVLIFELPQLVKAIQMTTNNISFYKEADKKKKYTSYNLKTMKLTVHLKGYVL